MPSRSYREVKGFLRGKVPPTRDALLVQETSTGNRPNGIAVVNTLVTTMKRLPRIKVLLYNQTEKDIVLKLDDVSVEAYVVQNEASVTEAYNNIQNYANTNADSNVAQSLNMTKSVNPSFTSSEPLSFDFGDSPISEEHKARVIDRLNTYADVFSHHEFDVGKTNAIEHEIKLTEGPYIREKPRPIPAKDFEDARRHIQALLDADIIKPSNSPYASPMVLVRKRNGKLRLVVDYRKINSRTIRDSYPLPKISEIFSALHGAKWFTTMDLKMGFHQIPMAESSKDYSAFICPFGLYSFERMSQGFKNSPLTFQRLMDRCVGDMNMKELLVYLDDLIVHGKSLEEAEERLFKTLDRLRAFGLKIDPKKCKFFQKSVKHLGHIVTEDGIRPDPEKVSALTTWPVPKTLKDLKSFLGFTGYFRDYVCDYSSIVKPLNRVTHGYIPLKTQRRLKAKGIVRKSELNMSSDITSLWTEDCQKAFEMIIEKLTSEPVLGFADMSSPFILHTDASNIGIGACLYQQQGDDMKIIAYASRGLSKSELNYPAHKKEFLALKWSVTDKFHDYLYGSKFTVVTDNNPLTYVLSTAKLDATGYRWLASLSVYDFDLKYRRGLDHNDADGLSRRPQHPPDDDDEYCRTMEDIGWLASRATQCDEEFLGKDAISALFTTHIPESSSESTSSETDACLHFEHSDWLEAQVATINAVSCNLVECPQSGHTSFQTISNEEWSRLQRADSNIREIISYLEKNEQPYAKFSDIHPELKIYIRQFPKLKLINNVLYRWVTDEKGMSWQQLVVPPSHRIHALTGLHNDISHAGLQTTMRLARQRVFWPYMMTSFEQHIKNCERCIRRKARPQKAEMESIVTSAPMELVCMDFLSLEPDSKGTKDILVITDHFTKYAIAVPTKNQTAKVVAQTLWDNLISHYGWPEKLHSDQGADFQSKVISELCKLGDIKKTRTTPYHPQGNPVERYNRTLIDMLGTLHESQKKDWRMYVKPLTHAYNCTTSDTTGYSPYFLMFGRHARLPLDIMFGTDPDARLSKSTGQYVKDLRLRLQHAFDVAKANTTKTSEKNKKTYNRSVPASVLEKDDRVLVKNVNIRGKHKLADRWERDVYVVKSRRPNMPVYTVMKENGSGPERILHRNLLLPCGSKEVDVQPLPPEKPRRMVTRSHKTPDPDTDDEYESCDEYVVDITQPTITIVPTVTRPRFTLSPNAAEFTPQNNPPVSGFIPLSDSENQDHSDLQPLNTEQNSNESFDINSEVSQPVINDQDNDTINEQLVDEISDQSSEETIAKVQDIPPENTRRSSRVSRPPQRMTFDSLGAPSTTFYSMQCQPKNDDRWKLWAIMLYEFETGNILISEEERLRLMTS